MNILFSASGVLILFFIVFLLGKKQKSLADHILIGWFLLFLLDIVTAYISYNNIDVWRGLFDLADSSAYLHGPLIWFYTLALTKEKFQLQKKDLWHLLPFVLSSVYLFYHLFEDNIVSQAGLNTILITKMSILLAYAIASLKQLERYRKTINNYFSFTDKIELNWLKLLIWGLIIVWVISVVSLILDHFDKSIIPQYGGFYTNIALSVFILIIGYFGLRQPGIFVELNTISETKDDNISSKRIEKISQIKQKEHPSSEKKHQQLLKYMEDEKPYLDNELSIYNLAAQMNLPPYILSQLINQYGGKNFFDFINDYRVKEVKQKIRKQAHHRQTLLAIALDCGFNSKSSFNRVFKKNTGITPREFVKSLE